MHNEFNYERIQRIREEFLPDSVVLDFVKPSPGDVILDLGSGTGHFSLLFSRSAENVTVYAVDGSDKALTIMKNNLKEADRKRVHPVLSDVCAEFKDSTFNKVFLSTVFHDLDCQKALLTWLHRDLPENGALIFVEFHKHSEIGPPDNIKIDQENLRNMVESHGFVLVRKTDLVHHYVHLYRRVT